MKNTKCLCGYDLTSEPVCPNCKGIRKFDFGRGGWVNFQTEDSGDVCKERWLALGGWDATDRIAKTLRERSGNAFSKCDDVEANIFRELANEFENIAKGLREHYDREYHEHEVVKEHKVK